MFYRFAMAWTKNALAPVRESITKLEQELNNMETTLKDCVSKDGLSSSLDVLGNTVDTCMLNMKAAIQAVKTTMENHAETLYDKDVVQTQKVNEINARVAVVEDRTKGK